MVEHAAAVNKMNALEIAVASAEQRVREGASAIAAAQREKARPLLAYMTCIKTY